jgi:hypothetical protein
MRRRSVVSALPSAHDLAVLLADRIDVLVPAKLHAARRSDPIDDIGRA